MRLLCGGGNNEGDTLGELDGTPIKETQNLLGDVVGIWSGTQVKTVLPGGQISLWTAAEWKQKFGESNQARSIIWVQNGDPFAYAFGYTSTYVTSAGNVGVFTDSGSAVGSSVRINYAVIGLRWSD